MCDDAEYRPAESAEDSERDKDHDDDDDAHGNVNANAVVPTSPRLASSAVAMGTRHPSNKYIFKA